MIKIAAGLLVNETSSKAKKAAAKLKAQYQFLSDEDSKVFVVIGGDGFMLSCIRHFLSLKKPRAFFGINTGRMGFLLNKYNLENLKERIDQAKVISLTPLEIAATLQDGTVKEDYAVNEISFLRHSPHTASLKIIVNNETQMQELRADGCLLSTSQGSTGYNVSANGAIVPLDSQLMVLTPICPFMPRRWNGAILPKNSVIEWQVLHSKRRPVMLACDNKEIGLVKSAVAHQSDSAKFKLLFDKHSQLDDKNIKAQFAT